MKFNLKRDTTNLEKPKEEIKKEINYLNIPKYDEDSQIKDTILTKDNIYNYVRVVNIRGEDDFQSKMNEKVIIGNRENPLLGNQHKVLQKTMAERLRVIEANKKDVEDDIKSKGPVWDVLQAISKEIVEKNQKFALECWCAPRPCHLDNLIPIIIEMVKELLHEKELELIKNNAAKIKFK